MVLNSNGIEQFGHEVLAQGVLTGDLPQLVRVVRVAQGVDVRNPVFLAFHDVILIGVQLPIPSLRPGPGPDILRGKIGPAFEKPYGSEFGSQIEMGYLMVENPFSQGQAFLSKQYQLIYEVHPAIPAPVFLDVFINIY